MRSDLCVLLKSILNALVKDLKMHVQPVSLISGFEILGLHRKIDLPVYVKHKEE